MFFFTLLHNWNYGNQHKHYKYLESGATNSKGILA